MKWTGNESTVEDLIKSVGSQFDLNSRLGRVTRSVIFQSISRGLDIDPKSFEGAKTFQEFYVMFQEHHPEELTQEREPDKVDQLKQNFEYMIRVSRIKSL